MMLCNTMMKDYTRSPGRPLSNLTISSPYADLKAADYFSKIPTNHQDCGPECNQSYQCQKSSLDIVQ